MEDTEIRYRGVTPHKVGWQVQVTGKYLGWFPNKKQAVAKVASVLKMPMAKLRKRKHKRRKRELMPLRTHKYIYWLTKPRLWQVKLPGHKSRHFPTRAQAVEAASAALKVPPASFRLRKGRPADHGREPASAYLARVFRITYGAYATGPKRAKQPFPCVPADAAYTYKKNLRGPGAKPFNDAGTVFPMLMAKNGPDKEAMLRGYEKHMTSSEDLEKLDYDRISYALQCMSKHHDTKEQRLWNQGPNKGTAHTMGLAMFALKYLKLIKPAGGRGSFPLGTARAKFKLCPLTEALRSRLRKTRAYGQALLAQKDPATKIVSLSDYYRIIKVLGKASRGVPGLASPESYLFRWSTRSWIDYILRSRGVWKGLKVAPKTNVYALERCFPDQSRHLHAFCGGSNSHGGLHNTTVQQLMKVLQYHGPIEHLTMHLCLCLTGKTRQIMNACLAKLEQTRGTITSKQEKAMSQKLERLRKSLTEKSKLNIAVAPHPTVTMQRAHTQQAI